MNTVQEKINNVYGDKKKDMMVSKQLSSYNKPVSKSLGSYNNCNNNKVLGSYSSY